MRGASRHLVCDPTIAIRKLAGTVRRPARNLVACSVLPRVCVHLPDVADNSHLTASSNGLGAATAGERHSSDAGIRSPAPFGNAGRTPSSGGDAEDDIPIGARMQVFCRPAWTRGMSAPGLLSSRRSCALPQGKG